MAATFALGGPVLAATSPTVSGPGSQTTATAPGSNHRYRSAAPTTAQQTIQQITQERLDHLRDQLHITAAEQPEWSKFAQTSMQNATSLDQLCRQRAEKVPTENAVQNMESFARIQTQQAADMERLVPEFKSLCSKLRPQQQQIADQTFRTNAERAQARASQRMQSKLSKG